MKNLYNKGFSLLLRYKVSKKFMSWANQTSFGEISLTYVEARHASNDEMLAISGHACGVILSTKMSLLLTS